MTLKTAGIQTFTATDSVASGISGSAAVSVSSVASSSPWPFVQSINRTTPAGPSTSATALVYTVTFSEAVTGVDPTDFQLVLGGTVAATLATVTPVSGAVYTVAVSGVTGNGTLGLNLVDNGSIHDLAGDPLTQQNANAAFQAPLTFAQGAGTRAVAFGDFNGDGKTDLAMVEGNSVAVLLGNGNGTFLAPQTFAAGLRASSLGVSDVNGDGKTDIVVDNADANSVSVLLGNGNGTFQAQRTFATGDQVDGVLAVGDVNGDGIPDIAVANFSSNTVGVLLGNGNGTFQAQQTFATMSGPYSVALSDVNGDGKTDLVVANLQSNSVSVLLGNGNGTFQSQQNLCVSALNPTHWQRAI